MLKVTQLFLQDAFVTIKLMSLAFPITLNRQIGPIVLAVAYIDKGCHSHNACTMIYDCGQNTLTEKFYHCITHWYYHSRF